MVDVLTVDDQEVFRAVARDVIESTPGFNSVLEAASGDEALELLREAHPELALVDMRMPGMDGIETTRRLVAAAPDLVVVLISIEGPANLPSEAGRCGAAALVRKQEFCPALLRELWAAYGS